MKMKTLLKLTALLGLLAWGASAKAGNKYDLWTHASSATMHVGYAGPSTAPAKTATAVFTSSGSAVFQSTTTAEGHVPFLVRSSSGVALVSVRNDGLVSVPALTQTRNPANCSPGSYPLGVDGSGAAENCTAAGTGDVISTQSNSFNTPATVQTFGSSVTYNGRVTFNVSPSTFHIAGLTATAQPNTSSTLGVCVTGSTRTVTAVGPTAKICYVGAAEFGGAGQGIFGYLQNGAFTAGQTASEGLFWVSKESAGRANASFCALATGLTVGTQYNFCLTFASNSPAITVPPSTVNAGARFYVESHP